MSRRAGLKTLQRETEKSNENGARQDRQARKTKRRNKGSTERERGIDNKIGRGRQEK